MNNEKKKKKGLIHFLTILIFLAIIAGVVGFGIPYFVEIPKEINFLSEFLTDVDEEVSLGLTISALTLFMLLACWLFASTKNSDTGTPRQMTNGDYNVKSDQKGSARWLTDKEIDALMPKCSYDDAHNHAINGFVLQTKRIGNKTYANYKGEYHCLILGTTGSGKTAFFVIPTMQLLARSSLHPSIVVTDPKGELYQSQTKLYKSKGYNIISINLREPLKKSNCWNPCYMAYCEYQEALAQKQLIKRHTDKVEMHPRLK